MERAVSQDPTFVTGMAWGKPRRGHPEGRVGEHVADLLERIPAADPNRRDLRFIALVHDALKHEVQNWRPRMGSNHHAARARRFAERFTGDERLLSTIELHDRPYGIWWRMNRRGRLDEAALEELLSRIADVALFLRFVELDGSTEGKDPEPVSWFREVLLERGLLCGATTRHDAPRLGS